MPTIIRCGGGIPVSDYESLQAEYNSYKSSHAHTNDEYNSYGAAQYSNGVNAGKSQGKIKLVINAAVSAHDNGDGAPSYANSDVTFELDMGTMTLKKISGGYTATNKISGGNQHWANLDNVTGKSAKRIS